MTLIRVEPRRNQGTYCHNSQNMPLFVSTRLWKILLIKKGQWTFKQIKCNILDDSNLKLITNEISICPWEKNKEGSTPGSKVEEIDKKTQTWWDQEEEV